MKINGKEINFEYTIGAYCDFLDYCAAHTEVSMARANLYKALYMNRAYVQAHGGDSVTIEEIMGLPKSDYDNLVAELQQAEESGSKRTVETVDNSKKKDINK